MASHMGDEHYEQLRYRFLNLLEPGFSLDKIPIVRSKSVFVTRSLNPNQPQSWEGDDKSITPSPILTIDPYDFSKPTEADGEIIHRDISKFGHTTNVLIYSFLDNNRGQQFTREEIRKSLESHKLALENNGLGEQHLTRIRTGKASVNYWIDRLVENGSLNKKHSNPVLFWLAR